MKINFFSLCISVYIERIHQEHCSFFHFLYKYYQPHFLSWLHVFLYIFKAVKTDTF